MNKLALTTRLCVAEDRPIQVIGICDFHDFEDVVSAWVDLHVSLGRQPVGFVIGVS